MTALIWVVQVVHYPVFMFLPHDKLNAFSLFHQRRISLIVLPIMLIELGSLIALNVMDLGNLVYSIAMILLIIIWGATFFLQVPCHQQLLAGNKNPFAGRLIRTNWIRTVCWTLKTLLVCLYV